MSTRPSPEKSNTLQQAHKNRAGLILLIVAFVAVTSIWFALWRLAYLYPDDLRFGTNFGAHVFGDGSAAELVQALKRDLLTRNGRISDVIVTILFMLPFPWRITMTGVSLLETVCLAGVIYQSEKLIFTTTRSDQTRYMRKTFALLIATAILLAPGALDYLQLGRLTFWPAANVNYLFELIFLYPVFGYLAFTKEHSKRGTAQITRGILAGFGIALSAFTIETWALTIGAVAGILLLVFVVRRIRENTPIPHPILITVALLAAAAELLMPGHYARLKIEPSLHQRANAGSSIEHFANSLTSCSFFFAVSFVVLVIAIVLNFDKERKQLRWIVSLIGIAMGCALVFIYEWRVDNYLGDKGKEHLLVLLESSNWHPTRSTWAVIICFLAIVIFGVFIAFYLNGRQRLFLLLGWVATLSSILIPLSVKSALVRAYFLMPLVMLTVAGVFLLAVFNSLFAHTGAQLSPNKQKKILQPIVAIIVVSLAIGAEFSLSLDSLEKRAEVYGPFFHKLETHDFSSGSIDIPYPKCNPAPRTAPMWGYENRNASLYRKAYDIPDSVKFTSTVKSPPCRP